MYAEILQTAAASSNPLNRVFLPLALVFGVVSYLRRKESIGGWLLYFYYWIYALVVAYAYEVFVHYRAFLRSPEQDSAHHLALIVVAYPRLLALAVVVGAAMILLKRREWVWVERLRLAIGVEIIIAGVSVGLDARYFPKSFGVNLGRCVMMLLWFLYFYLSDRVYSVFRLKDWESVRRPVPLPPEGSPDSGPS
jgi:hypothetical protein